MPVHRSHGKPAPEAPRHDEVPQGLPDPNAVPAGRGERDASGRFKPGNTISRVGGRRKARVQEHLRGVGLEWLSGRPELKALRRRANAELKAAQSWLMRTAGGGWLGPDAARELRSSVELDLVGDLLAENPKLVDGNMGNGLLLAAKMKQAASRHRLVARELCAKAAENMNGPNHAPNRVDVQSIDVSEELKQLMANAQRPPTANDEEEESDADAS